MLVWRWTPNGSYSASSAYKMLHHGATAFRGHRLVWKTWAPLRVRFFLWLTLRHRHWTADRRARHGLEARDVCFLCDQASETIDHIVAAYPDTRELWHHILQALHLQLPAGTASSLIWWRRIRALASGQRRKGLDTLFALVSWHVWKERNARCFRDASATINDLLQLITMEADRWINAGATGLAVLARS